ncbi:interferon-induced very large GTPase 1-like isoform X2 [Thalassophryne amazonica]|uniref:interferon-induced very large GTPase 1-like isoform X2 n=1 Tax=Thalassophryne amazonica TaxID=390379 RepID=UPI0014713B41|nr:interferon-induced very large GTPase 1-like isoform X2 [Thalassophryne amazonica]
MESTKEMEDTLQIAVHSFLQMNTVGEKQGCQFVHQNVGAVGAKIANAHGTDIFLADLNRMTLSAAKLAKREEAFKEFRDVLLYDPVDHIIYIDGLWQGSPPMAPINPGYSRKVQQLRQSIFKQIKLLQEVHKKKLYTLSAFTKRISDIWEAIKCENFIFSFQNCLSIETFNDARTFLIKCMMEVKQKIREETERQKICLKGFSGKELQKKSEESKQELESHIDHEAVELEKQLNEYSESCKYPHLLEKYLSDLQQEISHMKKSLEAETQNSIQLCVDMQKTESRSQDLMRNGRKLVEERVLKAATSEVMTSKTKSETETEFEKLWNDVTGEVSNLNPEDNCLDIDYEMRKIILNSPSINASIREKRLGSKKLKQYPTKSFTVTRKHLDRKLTRDPRTWLQYFASHVERFNLKVKEITESAKDRLQDIILKKNIGTDVEPCAIFENKFAENFFDFVFYKISSIEDEYCTITPRFHVELVLYLGAKAVKFFQKKHNLAIQKYHPKAQLQELKSHYFTIFKLYQSGADIAQAFTEDFLFDEVVQNVKAHFNACNLAHLAQTKLGTKLNDHQNVQLHMMGELAKKNLFSEYKWYIMQYDHSTKVWIKDQCETVLLQQTGGTSFVLQQALNKLHSLLLNLTDAMMEADKRQCETRAQLLRMFAQIVQQEKKLMEIKKEKLESFIKLTEKEKWENSKESDETHEKDRVKHFGLVVYTLLSSDTTKKTLDKEIASWDVRKHIEKIRVEDFIFKEVKSCESACPFCCAPCETHSSGMTTGEHEVTLHRPQGISGYRWLDSGKLVIDLCPTLVVPSANFQFKNKDTDDKLHPYKDYKKIYKDWTIRPNPNPQSLRYWKWVFAKFKKEFVSFYGADSVNIPDEWKNYSWKDVKEDMEGIFNIQLSS